MRKIYCYLSLCLCFLGILPEKGQTQTRIEKPGPIIIPEEGTVGAFVVRNGESLHVKSATSIILKGNIHLEAGSNVLLEIGQVDYPVDPQESVFIRNWTQTKTFGYLGSKLSESRSYFDDRGAHLQTLNRDMANNRVIASATIYDAANNPTLTTLPVPISGMSASSPLEYRWELLTNNLGEPFSYKDFDVYQRDGTKIDKRYFTVSLEKTTPNTLGWYYSNNNSEEVHVDVSSNPYVFESSEYPSVKKISGVSDVHRMGGKHENLVYSTPARNEVNHYLKTRNKFFTEDVVGKHVANTESAVSTTVINGNGDASINISLNGQAIISAIPGDELKVLNKINFHNSDGAIYSNVLLPLLKDQTVNINMSGQRMGRIGSLTSYGFDIVSPGAIPLTKGLYEYAAISEGFLTYETGLSDISYNFYNNRGLIVASIAPEGVKQLLIRGLDSFSTIETVPFSTTYQYDSRGFLASVTSAEQGRTEYSNRRDGSIRFSQNSLQRAEEKCSYTNYDIYDRVIEIGQIDHFYGDFSSKRMNGNNHDFWNVLEYRGPNRLEHLGPALSSTSDVVQYQYGEVDNSHGLVGYEQDPFFLQGALATTTKYSKIDKLGEPDSSNMVSKTWFSHNGEGLLLWQIKFIKGLGYKTTDYTYDGDGQLVKTIYQKNNASERMVYYYEYDANGQLVASYTNTEDNPATKVLHTKQQYYAHGGLKRMELGDKLQGLDYVYTIDGKLKSINNSGGTDPGRDGTNGVAKDVFAMNFEYHPRDYQRAGTGISSVQTGSTAPNYAGLINGVSWDIRKPVSMGGTSQPVMNTYSYDTRYNMSQSNWGTPNYTNNSFSSGIGYQEKGLTYDAHGNIKTLQRTGATGNVLANYQYNYLANSNKLESVGGYASYTYDALGQLASETKDTQTKYLSYDAYGKVLGIYRDAAKTDAVVTFAYDENGDRIKKQDHVHKVTTWYVDGNVYNGNQLIEQPIPSGIYYRQGGVYRYQLTDHVGSVRAIINRNKLSDGSVDVVYSADYYPFGTELAVAGIPSRYGYQGEYAEKDGETGWNNFYLRNYDPAIGRWLSVDPYGQYHSPYVGMGNNPVSGFDPDGGWSSGDGGGIFGRIKSFFGFSEKQTTTGWGGAGASSKWEMEDNNTYFGNPIQEVLVSRSVGTSSGFLSSFGKLPTFDSFHLNYYGSEVRNITLSSDFGSSNPQPVDRRSSSVSSSLVSFGAGVGAGALLGKLAGDFSWLQGGRTFDQYKREYWSTRTKPELDPIINRETGQVWKQHVELHHRYIPQRWKWAPDWLKNNGWNLKPLNSLEHALSDPYRARFAPKWIKDLYNLKWK